VLPFLHSLRTLVALRLHLWDRRLKQRGPFVRLLSWSTPFLGAWLLSVVFGLAQQMSAVITPELTARLAILLVAVAPVLLVTDALVRVGQGEGMAAALYHYPLSPGLIHAAELVAGLVSPVILGITAVLMALYGSVAFSAPLGIASGLLAGSFLIALSQLLRLSMASLLRKRYLREIAFAASSLLFLSLWLGALWVTRGIEPGTVFGGFAAAPTWFWLLPPAWFVAPVVDLPEVSSTARILGAFGAPVLVGGAFALGALLQDMACYGETDGLVGRVMRRSTRRGRPLADRWPFRVLHPAIWATMGKEIKALRRDPFLLMALFSQAVILLVPPLIFRSGALGGAVQSAKLEGAWGAYMPLFVLLLVMAKHMPVFNQVAMEGRGLLFLAQVPVERWKLLLGKNLAYFVLFGLFDATFLALAAWLFGRLDSYLFYLGMGGVALVLMLGVGNVVSVFLPAQWIGARAGAGGARAAQAASEGGVERPGCGVLIGRFLCVQVLYVMMLPPLLGMYAASWFLPTGGQVAAGLAIAAYCGGIYVIGTAGAITRFEQVEDRLRARFATRGSG
jgi:hypothetical protein